MHSKELIVRIREKLLVEDYKVRMVLTKSNLQMQHLNLQYFAAWRIADFYALTDPVKRLFNLNNLLS